MPYLLSKSLILSVLHEKLTKDEELENVAEDIARLIHMLLLSALFMPNNNSSVGWKLLRYLEEFDRICEYDWCGYLVEGLLEPMRKAMTLKIPGCSVFFLV